MLLSCVITLRPQSPATLPTDTGRATHAWFLSQVRRTDPALAEDLHRPNAVRPFTVSALRGVTVNPQGQAVLTPEQTCWLRVTTFEPTLSRRLLEKVLPHLPEEAVLADVPFTLAGATCDPAVHPWAGQTTFTDLAQEYLLGKQRPEREVALYFASPTTFRRTGGETALTDGEGRAYRVAGHNVPLPLPGLVFDSYLQRWNAFAPLAFPPEVRRYAEECLAVAGYRLQTVLVEYGEAREVGFVGFCRFLTLVPDPYWMRLIHLLAAFSFYAGTGRHTARGMGQTRPVARRHTPPGGEEEAPDEVD